MENQPEITIPTHAKENDQDIGEMLTRLGKLRMSSVGKSVEIEEELAPEGIVDCMKSLVGTFFTNKNVNWKSCNTNSNKNLETKVCGEICKLKKI